MMWPEERFLLPFVLHLLFNALLIVYFFHPFRFYSEKSEISPREKSSTSYLIYEMFGHSQGLFFAHMQRKAQEMINLVLSGIEARLSQANGDEDGEETQEVGAGWLNNLQLKVCSTAKGIGLWKKRENSHAFVSPLKQ